MALEHFSQFLESGVTRIYSIKELKQLQRDKTKDPSRPLSCLQHWTQVSTSGTAVTI